MGYDRLRYEMRKVAIIDYGLGNLRSVYNGFEYVGAQPFIADSPEDMAGADCAVLPGVGAFGDGMQILRDNGWLNAIEIFAVKDKKPFLGICLGMQLLAKEGSENGFHEGLGLIDGHVVRLSPDDDKIRIPHIGWNDVTAQAGSATYEGIDTPQDFYFVHSYVFEPDDPSVISGTCHHGQVFAASVESGNIWGVQFHPEKSQAAGLALLQNFLKAVPC